MEDICLKTMNFTIQAGTLGIFTHILARKTGNIQETKLRLFFFYFLILIEMIVVAFIRESYSIYNTISFMLTAMITLVFCLKVHPIKAFIISTLTPVVFGLSEIVVTSSFMQLFKNDFTTIMASQSKMLLVIIFESVFDFIVLLLLLFLLKKAKDLEIAFKNFNKKQLGTLFVVLSIYLIPQILIFNINHYEYPTPFLVINTVQFIGIMIFLFVYFKRDIELEKAQNELFTSELHNKTMIGVMDGVDTLKRDYNNTIHILNSYIQAHDYTHLEEYLQDLLGECNQVNNLAIINEEIFNEPAIYGIVGAKYFVAIEADITFDLDVKTDIKDIPFPMPELSRVLGILLDNALEATSQTDSKYMKLEFLFDERRCANIIRISNTFDPTITIPLSQIFKKGFSTKQIKSGIGLWEVKKIIDKQENATLTTKVEKNIFTHEILLDFMD